ncbi:MAG TPA: acyl-CoA dehydrogenase family protein [Hyphomicrobiaceae bacterium]|nr:acyl-CoA dehydrogenase family protein [Hyphomicrobiaceae bacterium]
MILSEEQQMIRQSARKFAQERLAPNSARWEEEARFPREIIAEMGALGFMGMTVPVEWGGAGADNVAYSLALQEIAAGDGALATVVSGHNSVGVMPILNYGTEAQKERWVRDLATGTKFAAFALTEPQGGSDAASIRTRATRKGDSYVLSGTKQFITSGATADVTLVIAVTDPDAGKRGISAFLVDTKAPGYQVARIEKKMGQNASDTCEIRLDDVVVGAEDRLGEEGQGYRIALANLEGGRIGIASQCVGMARAALEIAVRYAHERRAFGKAIFEHQAVSFRLADMATSLEAAHQLTLHAAALKDARQQCLTEASMAKLFASEAAERICSDALQTLGGAGYIQDFGVERICRGVRGAKIYEGTNDIQRLVISRSLV